MKHLIWLSLIAISLFALACSSAPAPVAPQAQQQAAAAAPIVAPAQAPVTKAAPGRSMGQTVHINMAASQVDMRWRDSLTKLRTIPNG